jgi:hypothetical protein
MPEWGTEWLDLFVWPVAGWVAVNMTISMRLDRDPLPGQPYCAGPNWRALLWTPAYARWRRARLEGNIRRG